MSFQDMFNTIESGINSVGTAWSYFWPALWVSPDGPFILVFAAFAAYGFWWLCGKEIDKKISSWLRKNLIHRP